MLSQFAREKRAEIFYCCRPIHPYKWATRDSGRANASFDRALGARRQNEARQVGRLDEVGRGNIQRLT